MFDKIVIFFDDLRTSLKRLAKLYHPTTLKEKGLSWSIMLFTGTAIIVLFILAQVWSQEPDEFSVIEGATIRLERLTSNPENKVNLPDKLVTGAITTATFANLVEALMDKPGGYLSNDKLPPGILLDNIPNWEYGVLTQVRDFSLTLRNDLSRSQTQSEENKNLQEAQTLLNIPNDAWMFPAAESKYSEAVEHIDQYLLAISDPDNQGAQFYARADNLRDWLAYVEKRLGSLSQRLSASVGQTRVNTDLAGDANARQATAPKQMQIIKTPWLEIDDVFYEARGSTWALIHLLKAVEHDFEDVLMKKNALVSLRQIIRELESTQEGITSPVVLNGSGFGLTANYSLVMASYISRANAAVIDLKQLLSDG